MMGARVSLRVALSAALSAVVALAWLSACGSRDAAAPAGASTSLQSMARASGNVTAPRAFTAAQVYLYNAKRQVRYMVFTQQGRFRAVALYPGNYEVRASAAGLESEPRTVQLAAGDNAPLDLALHALPPGDGSYTGSISMAGQNAQAKVTLHGYDDIYPPGAGRDIIERSCMICHGENWLPAQPAAEIVWNARIDHMMGTELDNRGAKSYAEGLLSYRAQWLRFSLQDRQTLLQYLLANFGPGAAPRMVRTDRPPAYDESLLGKAQYIEYLAPDDAPGQGVNDPQYRKAVGPFSSRRTLQDLRFDADGNVWATDRGAPVRLVKLDPRTGAWREWLTPHPTSDIHEILIDRAGIVWLPEHAEDAGARNYLLGFNPKTERWEHVVDMDPKDVIRNDTKWADSISVDAQGNLYVNWILGGALTKFAAGTHQVVEVLPLPSTAAIPYGNVIDSRGNVWLAMWGRGSVTKFDTVANTWTEFFPPTFPGEVRRLNVDAADKVWFGIYSAGSRRPGKLAQLDQKTGRFNEYTIPEQTAQPYDVAPDPAGNIWFADTPQVDRAALLGRFDPRTKTFAFYPKPQFAADTPKIQVTRDGAIWFAPRGSLDAPGLAVLYPDMDRIGELGAFYTNGPPGYPFSR
jgi:streptogramin lyase